MCSWAAVDLLVGWWELFLWFGLVQSSARPRVRRSQGFWRWRPCVPRPHGGRVGGFGGSGPLVDGLFWWGVLVVGVRFGLLVGVRVVGRKAFGVRVHVFLGRLGDELVVLGGGLHQSCA